MSNQDLKTCLEGSVYCSREENRAIIQFPVLMSDQEGHRLLNENITTAINDDDDDGETDVLGQGMS